MDTDDATASAKAAEAIAKAQAEAAAAASGAPQAGAVADALYAQRVADIVNKAINMGVQPITDEGEELTTLAPGTLG